MIITFIFWTLVFSVVGGFFIHFELDIPWLMGWLGKMPGDLMVQKDDLILFFPVTSAAVASMCITLFFSLFKSK